MTRPFGLHNAPKTLLPAFKQATSHVVWPCKKDSASLPEKAINDLIFERSCSLFIVDDFFIRLIKLIVSLKRLMLQYKKAVYFLEYIEVMF